MRFDHVLRSVGVSFSGEFVVTTHVGQRGIAVWTNNWFYQDRRDSREPRFPICIDQPDHETPQFHDSTVSTAFPRGEMGTAGTVRLSRGPRDKWRALSHLRELRERNRPAEKVQEPAEAPFFLPTTAGLEPKFAMPEERGNVEPKVETDRIVTRREVLSEENELQRLLRIAAGIDPSVSSKVDETSMNETSMNETSMNETPMNETPMNETPMNETSESETPMNETPMNETPMNETPMSETPIMEPLSESSHSTNENETPMSETPIMEPLNESSHSTNENETPDVEEDADVERALGGFYAVLQHFRSLSVSQTDAELSLLCMGDFDEVGKTAVQNLLRFLERAMHVETDFEMVQAILERTLQLYGELIQNMPEMKAMLEEMERIQERGWKRMQGLIQQTLCLVELFSNVQL